MKAVRTDSFFSAHFLQENNIKNTYLIIKEIKVLQPFKSSHEKNNEKLTADIANPFVLWYNFKSDRYFRYRQ